MTPAQASAAERSWTNSTGGTFSTSTNWQNGIVAGVNDAAIFNRSSSRGHAAYTVSFSSSPQNQAIQVKNDFVTLNLAGRSYTTTQITGSEIGNISSATVFNDARLTIQNGTFNMTGALTPQLLIGVVPNSVGALSLVGGGVLTGSPRLFVGAASASGALTLNGGTATVSTLSLGSGTAGSGVATLIGPFAGLTSNTLIVGDAGSGNLSMNTGAILTNNGTATIGNFAGSSGAVTFNTTGQWVQTGTLVIGNSGAGTVSTTTRLQGAAAILAHNPGGSSGALNVTGSAGSASFTDLTVGRFGFASMTVSGGARVDCTGSLSVIAAANVSHGRVDVVNLGSRWSNSGELLVGVNGNATLNIGSGGFVNSFRGTLGSFGTGTVNVTDSNSRWSCTGTLQVGSVGNGRLRITNGGLVTTNQVDVLGPASSVLVSGPGSELRIEPFFSNGAMIVSGGSLSIDNGGRVESKRAAIPSSETGGQGAATVGGANSLWDISDSMTVGFKTGQSSGAIGTLTINPGGVVDIFESLRVGNQGTIILNGGTLRLNQLFFEPTGAFNFNSGTLDFEAFPNLTMSATFLDKLLGPAHTIGAGRHLISQGLTIVNAPLVLDGGSLTVASLLASPPLQFDSGTFSLTAAPLIIGSSGPLGSVLSLDVRNVNVTNSTTIELGGQLNLRGGSFFCGGGITNDGLIVVDAPESFSFQNAIVNNAELRVAAGATANFVSNLTGSGSISGGGAKIFTTGSSSSVGAIDGSGTTGVEAAAALSAGRIREHSLGIGGIARIRPNGTNASTSRLNTLSIVGGFLDLADNALVVDYTAASPLAQIATFIQNGFASGSWNGAGINSSVAATTPNRAIGFAEATAIGSPATFAGQSIDDTTVLIRFTLPGDADLDRSVTIGDFSLLASNFNLLATWNRGDFNYDGTADIADFAALAANFNQSLPADLPRGAAVPEPASLAFIAAVALARRRRNDHDHA